MSNIFTSRMAKNSAAAAVAALGLIATTVPAEAAYCAQWNNGYCVDWRNSSYQGNEAAAALSMFGSVLGAVVGAAQPQYYSAPPAYYHPPAYYAPQPYYAPQAYGYSDYGYYGPEQPYGWHAP